MRRRPRGWSRRAAVDANAGGQSRYSERENLSSYLESKGPIAITRHGATIGIFVPTRPKPSQADLEALRLAGEKMQALIAAAGTTEEVLVEDFKKLRRAWRRHDT